MQEIGLILGMLLMDTVCSAAGLKELIVGGGGEGAQMLATVLSIFAIGLVGFGGSAILSMLGKGKFAKLFENGCYAMAFGLFFTQAIKIFNQFVVMITG